MPKQAASSFAVVTLLLAAVCAGQGPAGRGTACIRGTVITLEGHPVGNVRVDLRNALTEASLQSAYTNLAGHFEIGDVAEGRYLVVATFRLDEVKVSVQVSQALPTAEVILRLPRSFTEGSAGDATIARVGQGKFSGKAWPGTASRESSLRRYA